MYPPDLLLMLELECFRLVCNYIIQSTFKKIAFTPSANVISAMQGYNKMRAKAAKQLANHLPNPSIVNSFRSARSICQYNTCPPHTRCSFTNEPLSHGATLIVKYEHEDAIFCVQNRFLKQIHNYYSIVHFDQEIYKVFDKWRQQKQPRKINIEEATRTFLDHGDSSHLNLLYIKFNTICEI